MNIIRFTVGQLLSIAIIINHTRADEFGNRSIPCTFEYVIYFECEDNGWQR